MARANNIDRKTHQGVQIVETSPAPTFDRTTYPYPDDKVTPAMIVELRKASNMFYREHVLPPGWRSRRLHFYGLVIERTFPDVFPAIRKTGDYG